MNFVPLEKFPANHFESTFVLSFNGHTLKQPRGVVSHFPLQLIFVSDRETNSIFILTSDLQFITRFKYVGMVEPWNVCFSGDYESLYVVCDHGIIRFNGDYPIFRKPGFEVRGCVLLNDRLFTSACYLNEIHELDRDMNSIATIQPDLKGRKDNTLIIDFLVHDECFYILFLGCRYQLQLFDLNGVLLKSNFFNYDSLKSPLFITQYLHIIYISQRDLPEVACVSLKDDETSIFTFSTENRQVSNGGWKVRSVNRLFGIFYGIEYSPVLKCLIICEML